MNQEISHSHDGLWKVKTKYIVKGNNNNIVCFLYNNVQASGYFIYYKTIACFECMF